jgi:hypothetical protein
MEEQAPQTELIDDRSLDLGQCMLTEITNASCRCNDAVRFRYLARAETPSTMVVHKNRKPK